jgi:protein-S-isoprenylcysteine O-methyltransferase Ste14
MATSAITASEPTGHDKEAYLERRFGTDYETYRARVRRWM